MMQTFYQYITEATPPSKPPVAPSGPPPKGGPPSSPPSGGPPGGIGGGLNPSGPPIGLGGPPIGGPPIGGPMASPSMGGLSDPEAQSQNQSGNNVTVQRLKSNDVWDLLKKSLKKDTSGHKN